MIDGRGDRGQVSWWRDARPLLRVFAAFGVWSLCFVSLYGLQAVLCLDAFTLSPVAGKASLVIVWLAYLALLFLMLLRSLGALRKRQSRRYNILLLDEAAHRFLRRLAVIMDAAALTVAAMTGLPVVFIKTCA